MQIHSVLKRNGEVVGFETMTAYGRKFHLGAPPQAALRANQAAPSARCADCGRYRGMGTEPCGNCGAIPAPQPAQPVAPSGIAMPVPSAPWWEPATQAPPTRDLPFTPVHWTPKTGPETNMGARLDAAIAERAGGVRVGNFGPPPSAPLRAAPLVHARRLLTFAPAGATLDRVVQRQQDLGRQPASTPASPRTMAQVPCERCHRQGCACPPPAPETLTLTIQKKAADLAKHAAADTAAGLEPITKVVGMS